MKYPYQFLVALRTRQSCTVKGKYRDGAWPFFLNNESSDVSVEVSLAMTLGFVVLCRALVGWMFKIGYRLKS